MLDITAHPLNDDSATSAVAAVPNDAALLDAYSNAVIDVTERVGPDTCFIPFHFSGWWQGEDMLPYYPEGSAPIVRGEAVNTATTYGYDRITLMQETKTTLCQVAKV